MNSTGYALLLLALAAAPAAAQDAGRDKADRDRPVAGGGQLPAGWSARADGDAPLAGAKVAAMGSGIHVTLGPAVILYRQTDVANGDFHAVATFSQTRAPSHPEGYGLILGGQALGGEGQKYTYFLVRGDGMFIIKRRSGAAAPATVVNWTAHPAVVRAGADGTAKNELSVLAARGKVSFMVNGKEVYAAAAKDVDVRGIVGLRVNHNLDVHIDGFAVHRL